MAANRASKITPKIKKVLLSDRSLRAKWEIIEAELTLDSLVKSLCRPN